MNTSQPYVVEWIQVAAAFIGVSVSGFALAQAMMDLFAVVTLRKNGMNGMVAFTRLRREIFQFSVHAIFLVSGGYLVAVRLSGALPTPVPAAMGLLYTRNATITIASLILVANTLFDRAERYVIKTLDEPNFGQRRDDIGVITGDETHATERSK